MNITAEIVWVGAICISFGFILGAGWAGTIIDRRNEK